MLSSPCSGFLASNAKSYALAWDSLESDRDGEVDVDLSRANGLNFLPYLLGLALAGYGLYRRKNDSVEEEILDAIIEVEDQAKED